MESWRFVAGDEQYVLRRAPSLAMMKDRPFGHPTEVAVIRAARTSGVIAPEVIVELKEGDGIGSGFVMRALPGTPDPRDILASISPGQLVRQAAGNWRASIRWTRQICQTRSLRSTIATASKTCVSSSKRQGATGQSSRLVFAG